MPTVQALTLGFAPNSEEESCWLASEVSASVSFVAKSQRKQSRYGLERRDPEKAAEVLTELARGKSLTQVRSRFKLSGKVADRLARDHRELLERTHAWRVATSSRLAVLASRAFEDKLNAILSDPELLQKTPLRDLVLAFHVTLDQQRAALAGLPSPASEAKVTLEDARQAIEKAREGLLSQGR